MSWLKAVAVFAALGAAEASGTSSPTKPPTTQSPTKPVDPTKPKYLPFLSSKNYYEARVGCSLELSFYIPVDPVSVNTVDPDFFFYFSRDLVFNKGMPFFMRYGLFEGSASIDKRAYWSRVKGGNPGEQPPQVDPDTKEIRKQDFEYPADLINEDRARAEALGWCKEKAAPEDDCVSPMSAADDRFVVTLPAMTKEQNNAAYAYRFVRMARVTIRDVRESDKGAWYVRGAYNGWQGKATVFSIILKTSGNVGCPEDKFRHFGPGDLIFKDENQNTALKMRRDLQTGAANAMHSNAVAIMGPFTFPDGSGAGDDDRFLVESLQMKFAVTGADQLEPNTDGTTPLPVAQDRPCYLESQTDENEACKADEVLQVNPCVNTDKTNTWCKEGIEVRVYNAIPETRKVTGSAADATGEVTKMTFSIDQTAYFPTYYQNTGQTYLKAAPSISWPKTPITLKKGQYLGIVKKLLSLRRSPADVVNPNPNFLTTEVHNSEFLFSGPPGEIGFCRNTKFTAAELAANKGDDLGRYPDYSWDYFENQADCEFKPRNPLVPGDANQTVIDQINQSGQYCSYDGKENILCNKVTWIEGAPRGVWKSQNDEFEFWSVPDEMLVPETRGGFQRTPLLYKETDNTEAARLGPGNTGNKKILETAQNYNSVQITIPFQKGSNHTLQKLPKGQGFAFNAKMVFYDTYYPPYVHKTRKVVVSTAAADAQSNFLKVLGILLGTLSFLCCVCCFIYSRQAKRLKERRMFMASMLGTSFNISSETGEPLPPNWYEEKTPEGNIYYYNPTTQESMWDIPTFG